jgi:hypothetical protein
MDAEKQTDAPTQKRKRTPKEEQLIDCINLRRTSYGKTGEQVKIPRKYARILQDAGAIKVVI